MDELSFIVYCVDTSAWIEMKERYRFRTFPSLWKKLDQLIESKRLISPQEVYRELSRKDDELLNWAKQRREMFRVLDQEQIVLAKEILKAFPSLVDPQKEIPDADPFVIALAIVESRNLTMLGGECIVVSEEKPGGRIKPKIPDVCSSYDITHRYIVDFFSNEGWEI